MNYTAEQLKAWAASAADIRGEDADGVAQLRAHAAALEENARLKRHAEAMAELLRNQLETQAAGTWEWKAETESILDAYRAAHPKEGA